MALSHAWWNNGMRHCGNQGWNKSPPGSDQRPDQCSIFLLIAASQIPPGTPKIGSGGKSLSHCCTPAYCAFSCASPTFRTHTAFYAERKNASVLGAFTSLQRLKGPPSENQLVVREGLLICGYSHIDNHLTSVNHLL